MISFVFSSWVINVIFKKSLKFVLMNLHYFRELSLKHKFLQILWALYSNISYLVRDDLIELKYLLLQLKHMH